MSPVAAGGTEDDSLAVESRRRILDAAERLIAVRGIETVRLRDIAEEAGVSIGKIQHYFRDRETLVEEMLSAASLRRVDEWSAVASDIENPVARMVALLEHAITDRERCTVWLATTSVASRNRQFLPDVARIYDAWRAKLTEVIESGRRSGVFHPTAPIDEIADGIISAVDGLIIAVAVDLDGYTHERNSRMLRHTAGLMLGAALVVEDGPAAE